MKIQAARAQKLVADTAVVVAVDSFINEIVPGTFVSLEVSLYIQIYSKRKL